jgi:uncharacterized protein with beta-barrel porin domain
MRNLLKPSITFMLFIGFVLIFNSCKKEEVPTLTTSAITNITGTSATCGGIITDEGSGTVIAQGVCWSTSITPTIEDSKTTDGAGAGTFSSSISGLNGATTYYVRAYATNSAGTGYGMAMSFTTLVYNCMFCKQVTYVSGNIVNQGTEAQYCGDDFIRVKAIPNATVGITTVKWECR